MELIEVKKNQSLLDVAIEHYGFVDGVFQLVKDNPSLLGVTDNVFQGDLLFVDPALVKARIKAQLPTEGVSTITSDLRASGIGFWQINNDLIIQ